MLRIFNITDLTINENCIEGSLECRNDDGQLNSVPFTGYGTTNYTGRIPVFVGTIRTGPEQYIGKRVDIDVLPNSGVGLIL